MSKINLAARNAIRRQNIKAAVVLAFTVFTASTMPALPAHAAAEQVRTQAPGYYRMMLGDFEITALSDGTHAFPIDAVMTHVTKADIARDLARDSLTVPVQGSINAFLINTGKKLILIDTGAGVLYGDCCGRLMANLRASGYQPDQVDEVLLTHMHKDHVGGVIDQRKMAFPNAILRAAKLEADYWLNPANKASAPALLTSFFDSAAASVAPYQAAGRFAPFGVNAQLEPGIQSESFAGHTPGHTVYYIESGGKTLVVWGDIVHVAAVQLRDPAAAVQYDSDQSAAQRSRIDLLQEASRQGFLVGAAHIAFPGLGHLRSNGGHFEWIPANYDASSPLSP